MSLDNDMVRATDFSFFPFDTEPNKYYLANTAVRQISIDITTIVIA